MCISNHEKVKKRDPVTHVLFCDKLRKEGFESNIGLRFWKQLLQKLEKHLRKAAQYNQGSDPQTRPRPDPDLTPT